MQNKISNYTISLALGLIFIFANQTLGQKQPAKTKKTPEKVYNGLFIHTDLVAIAGSVLPNSSTFRYETGLQANILNKYYPIIELGYAGADRTTANSSTFKTAAPFFRAGVDFNLLKKKKDSKPTNNLFLVGLRFGTSRFEYDLQNLNIPGNYWNADTQISFTPQTESRFWWGISAGVRVEVFPKIFMGWNVNSNSLLSKNKDGEPTPWYIPGYGINKDKSISFNYIIGYKF